MTLIRNAEIWHARVVPNRPNRKYNKENPTWEVVIRTYDPAQKKEWEAQGVKMKAVVPEDGGKPYWKATIKKRIFKKDGDPSTPVEVKSGDLTQDIDPAIIGNGSVAHVRIYQYTYPKPEGGEGLANVLQGLQLKKLKKYTPKARDDDFEAEEMEVIEEDEEEDEVDQSSDDNDDPDNDEPAAEKPKATPSVNKKPRFD